MKKHMYIKSEWTNIKTLSGIRCPSLFHPHSSISKALNIIYMAMAPMFLSPALASPESSRLIYPSSYSASPLRHPFASQTFHASNKSLYSLLYHTPSIMLLPQSPLISVIPPICFGQKSRLHL